MLIKKISNKVSVESFRMTVRDVNDKTKLIDISSGRRFLRRLSLSGITFGFIMSICTGCAAVKPFEREKLSDPLIEPSSQMAKQSLDQKFFTSREGSIGGADGIGGGCGCAK